MQRTAAIRARRRGRLVVEDVRKVGNAASGAFVANARGTLG
jgi:hypothetical protein